MDSPSREEQEAWELAQIRQRPSRVTPKPIGNVVRRLMTRSGYGQTQAAQQLQDNWAAAVGPELAQRSRAGSISRGILTIHVSDSPTMQEIYFLKRKLIAKLQAEMPSAKIKNIRTRIS